MSTAAKKYGPASRDRSVTQPATAPKLKPVKVAGKQKLPAQAASAEAAALVLGLKIGGPRQSVFLRLLLPDEAHRQAFDKLCKSGVPERALESFLQTVCFAAHYGSKRPAVVHDYERSLPRELVRCASIVECANQGIFAPGQHTKEPYKKIYGLLPNIMRLYAATYRHLEHSADPLRKRRLTGTRLLTIRLLEMVVLYTGSPHYERLATLLTQGFEVTAELFKINGKRSQATAPAFFGSEALAKLYRSSANLRPSDFPRRHSSAR